MMPAPSWPERLYARLYRLYPAGFRARFGEEMRQSVLHERAAINGPGRRALLTFWVLTFIDLLRFGLAERYADRTRIPAVRPEGVTMLSILTTDLRDGWRSLRATPVVTAVAVLSLALGIGANTALFSILNGLVFKPLPVRDPARLAILADGEWTNPIWEEIRAREHHLGEGVFAWSSTRFDLSGGGETQLVDGAFVSGRMFDVLGIRPLRGRMIAAGDDVRGGGEQGGVAVISYTLWQRRFGGAEEVIGRRLTVDRAPFTIVGVIPATFFGPEVGRTMEVAIPIGAEPLIRGKESALAARSTWWLNIMVRLRPGDRVEQATERLRSVQPQVRAATLPADWPESRAVRYLAEPFTLTPAPTGQSWLRQRYVRPLTVILIVVGLVLLIACANIASLLLARAVARRHELSVRLALGASRLRLARQLLVEALLMAVCGAAAGLAFAHWASAVLVAQLTALSGEVTLDLSLDWRVLAFTTGVTGLTIVLFGLAPAAGIGTLAPQDALKEQGRGIAGDRRATLRHGLVVAQVALSLTLVVGALLFARTFAALDGRDVGFEREAVLIVNVNARLAAADPDRRPELFERLRERTAAVPGVESAAVSFTSPVAAGGWNTQIVVPQDSTLGRAERMSWVNAVTPDWFRTYGMRLLAGRDVTGSDVHGAPAVAVVNETFARRFLQAGNPVGQRFTQGDPSGQSTTYEVVGLVADAVYRSLRAPMMPIMYIPLAQWDRPSPTVVLSVRAAGAPPLTLTRSIGDALTSADPRLSVSSHTLAAQVDAALVQERLLARLSLFFGGVALLLAGLGLYGVTSYAVTSRRTEIGIRMALGANAGGVVRMVLRRVGWLVSVGVVLGTALSLWAARFVEALLYGLEPRDPLTLIAAAALLGSVAALAGWIPARRAARTDPTIVLREG